jgi:hypothetical protein
LSRRKQSIFLNGKALAAGVLNLAIIQISTYYHRF